MVCNKADTKKSAHRQATMYKAKPHNTTTMQQQHHMLAVKHRHAAAAPQARLKRSTSHACQATHTPTSEARELEEETARHTGTMQALHMHVEAYGTKHPDAAVVTAAGGFE